MKILRLICVFLAWVCVSRAASPTDADVVFFGRIKQAISDGRSAALAEMVLYPISIKVGDGEVVLRSPKDFVNNYQNIITKDVAHAVAIQAPERMSRSWRGVRVGLGVLWFDQVKINDEAPEFIYRITGINPDAALARSQSPQ